jgi:hypothetical protein
MAEHDKADIAADKKLVKKAIKQHDTQLHGGKKTTLSLKKGGPMGRNLARVANQRGSSRGR